jgi:hypothetical protein
MVSSGMLRRVALGRTDVSEELSASFIRVTRIGAIGTTVAVLFLVTAEVPRSLIYVTLIMEAIRSFEPSVLTRATRRNILQTYIFQNGLLLKIIPRLMSVTWTNFCKQKE